MVASRDTPTAEFAWGAFFLRWLGAVLAFTAAVVAAYLFIHEFLYDWSAVERSTRQSPHIADAMLQRAQETVRFILDLLHPSWFTWALAAGAPLLALLGAGGRIARAQAIGGRGVAQSLHAAPVTGMDKDSVRRVLFECVGARAKARGSAAPPVYLLEELDTVCAATFGSGPADAALVVSRGAAQRLDPATLEALIAWQLAALEGGRLHRDLRIAGFLHPFLWLWLMGDALRRLEGFITELEYKTTPEHGWLNSPLYAFVRSVGFAAMAVRLLLRIAGFPGLALARLLLREALIEDVRVRDRAVAASLPDPEALAAALLKSVRPTEEAGDLGDEMFAAEAEAVEFAHAFFAEPAPVPNEPRLAGLARRLSSHEDPLLRLRRIAPRFDAAAYEQRAAKIAADKDAPGFAHGAPDASMLSAGAAAPAPAAPAATAARHDIGDPAEELAREEFFLRFERPVLDLFRTPQGASRVLRAAVAPSAPGNDALGPLLERLGARERRWVIERGLAALREAPENVRAAHLRAHRLLIEMDRRVTLDELTDWLYVERGLGLVPAAAAPQAPAPADAALLQSLLAGSGAQDAAAIEAAMRRLRAAPMAARVQLVRNGLAAARADGSVSEAESELLRRLCFILDLSPALLRDPTPKAPPAMQAAADYAPPRGVVLRTSPGADELPVKRRCERCQKDAALYFTPREGALSDWVLPVLFVAGTALLILWLGAPQRSARPDAWRNAIALWLLLSVAFVYALILLGFILEGVVLPRWLDIGVTLLILFGSTALLFSLDQGLGVMAGNAVIWISFLATAFTRKMGVPKGLLYFCRACGMHTPVDATVVEATLLD